MDSRKFSIFYKVNVADEFPGNSIEVKTSDYIKIKHNNVDFSFKFLINFFKQKSLYSEEEVEKLWISIDDIEYTIIYDKYNPVSLNIERSRDHNNRCELVNQLEKDEDVNNDIAEVQPVNNQPSSKSKSDVWQHFVKIKDKDSKVKCLHCGGIYESSKTTTNLRQHLFRKHPIIYPVTKTKSTVISKTIKKSLHQIPEKVS